jgi:hypothetical protein
MMEVKWWKRHSKAVCGCEPEICTGMGTYRRDGAFWYVSSRGTRVAGSTQEELDALYRRIRWGHFDELEKK